MNEVLSFINRRFTINCDWISGNCYYFALILQARFGGAIYYDLVDGHFVIEIQDKMYDWTGWRADLTRESPQLVDWENYWQVDPAHYKRIVRDCIL